MDPVRENELRAAVQSVTVMEDRAQVERRGSIHLTPGRHLLAVDRVTPLVVDRTLRGKLAGPGGRLVDLEVERTATQEATRPDEERELTEKLKRLGREQAALEHGRRQRQAEEDTLAGYLAMLQQHISEQGGRGQNQHTSWSSALTQLDERLEEVASEVRALAHEGEDLSDRVARLEQRRRGAMQPTSHYWARLTATVQVEEEGDYSISWEYLVPCAIWRPSHQAALDGRLKWTTFGTVWQNTGEAWKDVELRLSTERPALGANLPLLQEDSLTLRPRTDAERETIQVSSRDEEIEVISPGLDQRSRGISVPGVDDGGEVRVFSIPDRVSVPSDGRAHLIEIDSFECEPRLDLVCVPELAAAVMQRSRQVNAGAGPLLAGPVRLIEDGGFMGRTQIPFVSQGEEFALGWGTQDALQVVRRTGRQSEEGGLTRRARHDMWTRTYLSNTGRAPRSITVIERLPVSEVEQVEIQLDRKKSTAGFEENSDGHLRWQLELPPASRAEVALRYRVLAHRKVVWNG